MDGVLGNAAFSHLYGIDRVDTDDILGTFPITLKNEEGDFGEFRTRRTVLEEYGRMAEAISGQNQKPRNSSCRPTADPSQALLKQGRSG